MDRQFDNLGPLLAEMGDEAAYIVGGDPDGIYIYAEVQDGSTFGSVFKDEGDLVRYYDPSDELCAIMRQAWELEDPGKRWRVMEYEVHGTKFDVHFTFPEDIDLREHASARRPVALRNRYGDKPIVYPPIPERFLTGSARLKPD